jgi:integrase
MTKRCKTLPSYRLHKQSGQAVVTLGCAVTGKRRDIMLGEYGTPDSRVKYAETIAQWERDGRILDNAQPVEPTAQGVTVTEIMLDWWRGELERYGVTDPDGRLPSGLYRGRSAVRIVRATCGKMPAADFGPKALQQVRAAMVAKGWSRGNVNSSVATVIRAFRQGVAAEKVNPATIVALECVKALRRGEQGAPEGRKVKPVPVAHVEAVKPHLSRQVQAIIDTMLLTGARCAEVCAMRPCDIEPGTVWTYRPARHKTEHRGRDRLIHIGPRAQKIIGPFMAGRPIDAPLFSPAEAEAERREQQHRDRKTPLSYGNRPGSNRKARPRRQPGESYTTGTVRRAICRACKAADVPAWTPHQLRHAAATMIRKAAGVEAAAIVLGHSSATLTDGIYAERDSAKAAAVIARVG